MNEHLLTKAHEELANVKTVTGCEKTSDPQGPFTICPWSCYTTGDLGNAVQKQPGHLKCCLPVGCRADVSTTERSERDETRWQICHKDCEGKSSHFTKEKQKQIHGITWFCSRFSNVLRLIRNLFRFERQRLSKIKIRKPTFTFDIDHILVFTLSNRILNPFCINLLNGNVFLPSRKRKGFAETLKIICSNLNTVFKVKTV